MIFLLTTLCGVNRNWGIIISSRLSRWHRRESGSRWNINPKIRLRFRLTQGTFFFVFRKYILLTFQPFSLPLPLTSTIPSHFIIYRLCHFEKGEIRNKNFQYESIDSFSWWNMIKTIQMFPMQYQTKICPIQLTIFFHYIVIQNYLKNNIFCFNSRQSKRKHIGLNSLLHKSL